MKDEETGHHARAMLLWGDSRKAVFAFLTENGSSDQEARAIICDATNERRREIQMDGLKKIAFGLCVVSIPAGYFLIFGEPGTTTIRIAALFGAIGIFGLWKLIDGLSVLLLPNSTRGSVSELGE